MTYVTYGSGFHLRRTAFAAGARSRRSASVKSASASARVSRWPSATDWDSEASDIERLQSGAEGGEAVCLGIAEPVGEKTQVRLDGVRGHAEPRPAPGGDLADARRRSEEGRVGKECRSRW